MPVLTRLQLRGREALSNARDGYIKGSIVLLDQVMFDVTKSVADLTQWLDWGAVSVRLLENLITNHPIFDNVSSIVVFVGMSF